MISTPKEHAHPPGRDWRSMQTRQTRCRDGLLRKWRNNRKIMKQDRSTGLNLDLVNAKIESGKCTATTTLRNHYQVRYLLLDTIVIFGVFLIDFPDARIVIAPWSYRKFTALMIACIVVIRYDNRRQRIADTTP